MVTNLNVLHQVALRHYYTGTFMATHERKLCWKRPIAIDCVQVGVADSGILDVDEDLIWSWLLDWDLFVFDWAASLLDDLRPLLLRDFLRHARMDGILMCVGGFDDR